MGEEELLPLARVHAQPGRSAAEALPPQPAAWPHLSPGAGSRGPASFGHHPASEGLNIPSGPDTVAPGMHSLRCSTAEMAVSFWGVARKLNHLLASDWAVLVAGQHKGSEQ